MNDFDPTVLRSAANPTVRHLIRMRDNRARRRAGRVIVDGWRETSQAIEAGLQLCAVYLPESAELSDPDFSRDRAVQTVLAAASPQQHRQIVSDSVMGKICFGQSSRGVVAEFEEPKRSLQSLPIPSTPLILILDQIEKPGNVGAVFRCADAAGVDAVLLCGSGGDVFNPNAIRSSLGAVFRVPSANASETLITQYLIRHQIRALAARLESSRPLWSSDLTLPLAIIFGNESAGLGERWQMLGDQPIDGVRIPMLGETDSLNLSVSAAVIAFEVARRRGENTSG